MLSRLMKIFKRKKAKKNPTGVDFKGEKVFVGSEEFKPAFDKPTIEDFLKNPSYFLPAVGVTGISRKYRDGRLEMLWVLRESGTDEQKRKFDEIMDSFMEPWFR